MRPDIRLKKNKMLYAKVDDYYCKEFLTVKKSCEKAGISTSVYYKICKDLGKNSVGTCALCKHNVGNNARNVGELARISNKKTTKPHTLAHHKPNSKPTGRKSREMRGGDNMSTIDSDDAPDFDTFRQDIKTQRKSARSKPVPEDE
jgi:hypothetical protein